MCAPPLAAGTMAECKRASRAQLAAVEAVGPVHLPFVLSDPAPALVMAFTNEQDKDEDDAKA